MPHWDPVLYSKFAEERGRPFVELLRRIRVENVNDVVDLGCGPGALTALLTHRWPNALVRGVDASPEMIQAARKDYPDIEFIQADIKEWLNTQNHVDVLITNAALQWIPDHRELLGSLLDHVRPGG